MPAVQHRDIRDTPLWAEVEEFYRRSLEGQLGAYSSLACPVLSPDGSKVAFTGSGLDSLDEPPWRRVYLLDRESGQVTEIPAQECDAHDPAWSPSGQWVAFLAAPANGATAVSYFQPETGRLLRSAVQPAYGVDGFAWCPSADRLLAWSSERRPELGTVPRHPEADWIPAVRATFANARQDVFTEIPGELAETGRAPAELWIWEAAWVGPRAYLALASDLTEPPDWYRARLVLVETVTGTHEELYQPQLQAGRLSASPDGQAASWIEGLASDRGMIAGVPVTLDLTSRTTRRTDIGAWEVTDLRWRDDKTLGYLGLCGSQTVAGNLDAATLTWHDTWTSDGTCGMPMPSGFPADDSSFLIAYEDWHTPPALRIVGVPGEAADLARPSPAPGPRWLRDRKGTLTTVKWTSPDGLAMSGLLITPSTGKPPFPLIVNVHGGPVWAWRNNWEIVGHTPVSLLVSRGFAVLNPNGRGSVGRGPAFVNAIRHAMGHQDVSDYTSAAQAMIERGIAAPGQVSVIGHSYGGFMASCLAASDLFAAAVAISPATDWLSQHYVSAIPGFDRFFVAEPAAPGAPRGPIELAASVTAATLVIGCEDDECCPVGQAIEFYRAIAEHGTADAALAVYPAERHGIRGWPALLDQSVRIVAWLERYAR
jgi:dipeptidyl aminopeptidase/acylaminoacyl peptidase